MPEPGFQGATDFYGVLDVIERSIAIDNWDFALRELRDVVSQARRFMEDAADRKPWRDFIDHSELLHRSIRFHDFDESTDALSALRSDLRGADGAQRDSVSEWKNKRPRGKRN
jgi:hypothetical protein